MDALTLDRVKKFQSKYELLSSEEKRKLVSLFRSEEEFSDNYRRLQKAIFVDTPPNPHEFLNPENGWLTKRYVDKLWDNVKQDFVDILDRTKVHSQIVRYGCTRQGKSFLARLLTMYSFVFCHYLRDPYGFFNVSEGSAPAIYIISFKFAKAEQLLLSPLLKLFQNSPRFVKVHLQDAVKPMQDKIGLDRIVWSKAGTATKCTFASGVKLLLGNDKPSELLGADIIQVIFSELAFFIEKAGATEEQIYQLYTDAVERIQATVGINGSYLSHVYLDTSANNADSPVEKYILQELPSQENVFFKWRKRWDIREIAESSCKTWLKTGETFRVITGNRKIQAKIINSDLELEGVPPDLVQEVPIDYIKDFKRNLLTSIKNIGGWPTSAENKFIQDPSTVENMFVNELTNIESLLIADAQSNPDGLLWKEIVGKFFIQLVPGQWRIRRALKEPRWFGIDLAKSIRGDLIGLSIVHKEFSKVYNSSIYVVDVAFCVGPGDTGINLDAIWMFLRDYCYIGNVIMKRGRVDTYQSASLIQNLTRSGIECDARSVDTDTDPYNTILNQLSIGHIKSGKNIFLKNNLLCLQVIRNEKGVEHIDHPAGQTYNVYDGNWSTSTCGLFAKDCSDGLAQAIAAAKVDLHVPVTVYEEENFKYSEAPEVQTSQIEKAFKGMMKGIA